MKVTNIGTKIVNIGARALLPGESTEVPAEFENSALDTLASMGFITTTSKNVSPKAAGDAEAKKKAAEEEAKKKADEEAAKSAGGSK